jgi:hypothetical protein
MQRADSAQSLEKIWGQRLPTRGYGGPPIHNMGFFSRFGESPNSVETFRADADPGSELSHLGLVLPRDRDLGRV